MANITNTLIHSLQITLMATGFVFIAIFLAPPIFNFTSAQLPPIWSSIRSWLRPPYIYLIIHGIIIAIAAFSRLSNHQPHPNVDFTATNSENYPLIHHDDQRLSSAVPVKPKDIHSVPETEIIYDKTTTFGEKDTGGVADVEEDDQEVEKPIVVNEDFMKKKVENDDFATVDGDSDESDLALTWKSTHRSTTPPPPPPAPLAREGSSEIVSSFFQSQIEKPPASAKSRHRRKPTRTVPEGGNARRAPKPNQNETLESTWKAIRGGQHVAITRQLNRSDTWENLGRQNTTSNLSTPPAWKKSKTFKDRTSNFPTRLEKEPSLSQDELNRRSEEFINKVNEEMKLQRQKSIQQSKLASAV